MLITLGTRSTEPNVDVLSSLSSDVDGSSDSEQSESDSESATNTAVTGASSSSHGGKRYFTGGRNFQVASTQSLKRYDMQDLLESREDRSFCKWVQKLPFEDPS